jgi:hypothetical protein
MDTTGQRRQDMEAPTHAKIRATGEIKEIASLRMDEDVAGVEGATALTLVFTDGTEEFAEMCEPVRRPR